MEPSQPLSTIDALILCLLLLAYDPFRHRDGELFAIMLSIYPVTRFFIEFLRSDEAAVLGTGLSIGQCVSLLLLVFTAGLWFYILRRPKGMAFSANISPRPLEEGQKVRAKAHEAAKIEAILSRLPSPSPKGRGRPFGNRQQIAIRLWAALNREADRRCVERMDRAKYGQPLRRGLRKTLVEVGAAQVGRLASFNPSTCAAAG